MEKLYFTYIITNFSNEVLYIGITNDLSRRIWEHKEKLVKGFSNKYNANKLVYYEIYTDVNQALVREKRMKKLYRKEKIELIENFNPEWNDLYFNL